MTISSIVLSLNSSLYIYFLSCFFLSSLLFNMVVILISIDLSVPSYANVVLELLLSTQSFIIIRSSFLYISFHSSFKILIYYIVVIIHFSQSYSIIHFFHIIAHQSKIFNCLPNLSSSTPYSSKRYFIAWLYYYLYLNKLSIILLDFVTFMLSIFLYIDTPCAFYFICFFLFDKLYCFFSYCNHYIYQFMTISLHTHYYFH